MSIPDKNEEKQSSALWDWVIGIGLVLLIGAGIWFYQSQKKESHTRFSEADVLFQSGEFRQAAAIYEELKQAQYATPSQDSLLYERLDSIAVIREQDEADFNRVTTLLEKGDTLSARIIRDRTAFRGMLDEEEKRLLESF